MMRRPRRPRHDAVLRRTWVHLLLDAGLTPAEVARRMKCSRTTVWRAEKRFRELLAERGIDVNVSSRVRKVNVSSHVRKAG